MLALFSALNDNITHKKNNISSLRENIKVKIITHKQEARKGCLQIFDDWVQSLIIALNHQSVLSQKKITNNNNQPLNDNVILV